MSDINYVQTGDPGEVVPSITITNCQHCYCNILIAYTDYCPVCGKRQDIIWYEQVFRPLIDEPARRERDG